MTLWADDPETVRARFFRVSGPLASAIQCLDSLGNMTWTNAPTNAIFTIQTAFSVLASNWADYVQVPVTGAVTSHRVYDGKPPSGMALIPAGSVLMGDTFSEGDSDARPTHTVYVSAFYMDRYAVSKALWDDVYQWATKHSYSFSYAGSGKAANHPVQTMNWYDAVKWCNARSDKEGRVPAYYTDAGLSTRYRSGQVAPYVNWNSGYRLPTEAEWEKAARGGASGQRFPWGNTITHSLV
jgi:formylglycine-generating enzyme required for sulfatase activity